MKLLPSVRATTTLSCHLAAVYLLRLPVVAGGCIDNYQMRHVSWKNTSGLSQSVLHRSSLAFSNHFVRAKAHFLEESQNVSST